jgi:hypothetical protein
MEGHVYSYFFVESLNSITLAARHIIKQVFYNEIPHKKHTGGGFGGLLQNILQKKFPQSCAHRSLAESGGPQFNV